CVARCGVTSLARPLTRLPLPGSGAVGDVIEHLGRQHKITAIDGCTVSLRFFLEPGDLAVLDIKRPEASRRLYRRHRRQRSLRLVKLDELADVHIGDTITVREAK